MENNTPLVIVDAVSRTVYVRGQVNSKLPLGWRAVDVSQLSKEIKAAIALRDSGFMSVEKKIPGIKLIRSVSGCGLAEAKYAFETVYEWDAATVDSLKHV